MRNALLILSLAGVIAGVSLVPALAFAGSADRSQSAPASALAPVPAVSPAPASIYAPQLDTDQQLLPVRGSDLPLSTGAATNGSATGGPQSATVEAIPTPTAFHAGGLLLMALFAARYIRKLRFN